LRSCVRISDHDVLPTLRPGSGTWAAPSREESGSGSSGGHCCPAPIASARGVAAHACLPGARHTAPSAADQAASAALDAGAVRGYDGAVGGLGSGLGRWTLWVLRRWRLGRATFAGDSSGRGDGCGDGQGGEGALVVARKDAARTSMEDSGSFVVVLMSTPRSLIPDRVATAGQRPAAPSTEVPRVRNGPLTGDRGRLAPARPWTLLLPAERARAGGTGCTRRVCASAGPGPSARRRH